MNKNKDEKNGRFVAQNTPKPIVITTRFTDAENARITQAAANKEMTVSEYVRFCALVNEWHEIVERVTAADWKPK